MFGINQHKLQYMDFQWLGTTFCSAVADIGHTVMVMNPWNHPLPFTRAWCIFEVYASIAGNCTWEIALSDKDRQQFLMDIQEDPGALLEKTFATIDSEKSQCFLASDRSNIFEVIRATVGFDEINTLVFDQYRNWAIQVAIQHVLEEENESMDDNHNFSYQSMLHYNRGTDWDQEASVKILQFCLTRQRLANGDDHPQTLAAIEDLASCYQDNIHKNRQNSSGEVKYTSPDAGPLWRECFQRRQKRLGDDHPDTLRTLHQLAVFYDSWGLYSDYENATFYDQDQFETNAKVLFRRCWRKRGEVLGESHPDTMESLHCLAFSHLKQCEDEYALPLLEECYQQRCEELWECHPDTLKSLRCLASAPFYRASWKWKEIATSLTCGGKGIRCCCSNASVVQSDTLLLEESLDKTRLVFGDNHPRTLQAMEDLENFLSHNGALQQANELRDELNSKRRVVFGKHHPNALKDLDRNTLCVLILVFNILVCVGLWCLDLTGALLLLLANYGIAAVLCVCCIFCDRKTFLQIWSFFFHLLAAPFALLFVLPGICVLNCILTLFRAAQLCCDDNRHRPSAPQSMDDLEMRVLI